MGCFPCFGRNKEKEKRPLRPSSGISNEPNPARLSSDHIRVRAASNPQTKDLPSPRQDQGPHIAAQTFTFRELAVATKNFRPECLIGEGGFGRVYKGKLESTGQIVAVKQLDRNGLQGNREFLVEVLMLSLLHHTNLVNLIGYCADGDQRILVYEYMPLGCLEDHLHDLPADKEPLDWNTRMRIAAGAARGLEYLHDKASPPVIYRDFKSSNILLGESFHPKLSDFGLAKLGPVGDKTHVSTRVMGTYGYCAPEYAMTGQLTVKSDVYSFGVVLLELITGRKAIDATLPAGQHNLVAWARPLFKDRRKFPSMADPMLSGKYPMRGLYQALAVAAMCLQEQASTRPLIGDVVTALSYLAAQPFDPSANQVTSHGSRVSRVGLDRRSAAADGGGAMVSVLGRHLRQHQPSTTQQDPVRSPSMQGAVNPQCSPQERSLANPVGSSLSASSEDWRPDGDGGGRRSFQPSQSQREVSTTMSGGSGQPDWEEDTPASWGYHSASQRQPGMTRGLSPRDLVSKQALSSASGGITDAPPREAQVGSGGTVWSENWNKRRVGLDGLVNDGAV